MKYLPSYGLTDCPRHNYKKIKGQSNHADMIIFKLSKLLLIEFQLA